jgi:chemotaxis protein methyltransferase CheR
MIHETELTKISEHIEHKLGLSFPNNRFSDLKRALHSALPEIGFGNDVLLFCNALYSNNLTQQQLDTLALYLTIGETYFFREKICLDAFTHTIVPELIKNRNQLKREIRIWSAGCCTGEEAYTIAILLIETIPDIETWQITIIGTDVNRNFIHKAKNGRYTQWSFRDTPDDLKKKYFTQIGKEFEVIPEIKKMVSFSYLNLADNKYPLIETNTYAMDVIFCRNVLMYFSTDQAQMVVNRFKECLNHEGWLITSPVEVANACFSILNQVTIHNAMVYRKSKWNKHPKLQLNVHHTTNKVDEIQNLNLESSYFIEIEKQQVEPAVLHHKKKHETELNDQSIDLKKIYKFIEIARYEDARMLLQKLIIQHPDDVVIKFLLVKVLANMGHHSEARILCEELISINKMNADYYYLLANILFDENKKDEADTIINQVLYIDHNHVLAHFLKGNISRIAGKRQVAIKHYKNLLSLIQNMNDSEIIAESDGLTVGRLRTIIFEYV